MSRILALIDASIYAESVCDHAVWVAERLGWPVELLHVLGKPEAGGLPINLTGNLAVDGRDALLKDLAEHDAQRARLAQQRGRVILEAARTRIEHGGIDDVTTTLRHGDFVETFEAQAGSASIGVLGKRGEAADFAKGHLGSNLERAVRASPIPLLVASRGFRPVNSVVVAFDGGASAAKAVAYMADSPLFAGTTVTLLTVGRLDAAGHRAREAALNLLSSNGFSPVAIELEGDPAAGIAGHVEAEGVDMLVMGAYGHSRIRTLVIGSTTSEMLRACRVPVLMFR
jgi:nucleotide-binding universal stress UspA family protein